MRLQVLLDEKDFREIQRLARRRHMKVAEWVREALRAALRAGPRSGPDAKLVAIRAAARGAYPTADVDQMLSEVVRGYMAGT